MWYYSGRHTTWDYKEISKKHPSTPNLFHVNMEAASTLTPTLHKISQKTISRLLILAHKAVSLGKSFRYFEGTMFVRNVENKLLIFQRMQFLKSMEFWRIGKKWSLILLLDSWFYIMIVFAIIWYWSIENCWDLLK